MDMANKQDSTTESSSLLHEWRAVEDIIDSASCSSEDSFLAHESNMEHCDPADEFSGGEASQTLFVHHQDGSSETLTSVQNEANGRPVSTENTESEASDSNQISPKQSMQERKDSVFSEHSTEGACSASPEIEHSPTSKENPDQASAKMSLKDQPSTVKSVTCKTNYSPSAVTVVSPSKHQHSAGGVKSCSDAQPLLPLKETKTGMWRKNLGHQNHRASTDPETRDDSAEYLTPSQKKDKAIRDLKKELHESQKTVDTRDAEIQELIQQNEAHIAQAVKEKEGQIQALETTVGDLKEELAQCKNALQECQNQSDMKDTELLELEGLRVMAEERQRDMYLKMFTKGQKSALFERQDTIEEITTEDPGNASMDELVSKLAITQAELQKWQARTRQMSYDGAKKPETEAEVILRFLRDAMFHYLTDSKEERNVHLRATVQMLDFTDIQINKINKAGYFVMDTRKPKKERRKSSNN